MQNYKITYKAGKNEHVIELEATDKEQAQQIAETQYIGQPGQIISIVHVPESYELF